MNKHFTSTGFKIFNKVLAIGVLLLLSVFAHAENITSLVEAYFIPNATEARPNDIIYFNNTSTNAVSYEWQLDGVFQSTDEHFDFMFDNEGLYEVSLIAADATCQDTFSVLITIALDVFVRNGMPMWPGGSQASDNIAYFDWRNLPYQEKEIPNTDFPNKSKLHAGFDNCGALAFVVFHKGGSDPNSLIIYGRLGNELLTENTNNGGGFNAMYGTGEIQVVKVPGFSNEWYIIYSEWSTMTGPYDPIYNPARILYSRVQLLPTGVLNVIQRDQILTDNNGVAYRYVDGKAVSRTANGNLNAHFLYACRRDFEEAFISLDRFMIDANGITFEANTGNVPSDWWELSISQSTVELSPREDIVAINTRHQDINIADVFLFDAADFSNTNYRVIKSNELMLVADGGPNDFTSLLPSSDLVSNIAADTTLNFSFLKHLDRKYAAIEFSPNGRFLYMNGGGFPGLGNTTHLTYLAQVDLATNPLEVRLQIQTTPNNVYTIEDGKGCAAGECTAPWTYVSGLESGYDGNLYFNKRGTELFVVPDPNNFMPQNLDPSNINFASSDESNISASLMRWGSPDQIDGFNYLDLGFREIEVIVTRVDCAAQCVDPYQLDLKSQGELITSIEITQCPDTFFVCVDTTLVYDFDVPMTDIEYNNAITLGEVNYPTGASIFDLSNNEFVVIEELAEEIFICEGEEVSVFGEMISEPGLYFNNPINTTGCDTLDAVKVEFYDLPLVALELTAIPCDSTDLGSIQAYVVEGVGPYEYQWNYNNANTNQLLDVPSGIYTLDVIDGNGCTNTTSIEVLSPLSTPELNFEIQDVLCYGDQDGAVLVDDAGSFYEYSLDGVNYQNIPVFNDLAAGQYQLYYSNEACDYSQAFEITQPEESVLVLPDDVTINLGDSYEIESQTTINADPIVYNWTPTETLSCDDCGSPIATPLNTTLYALSIPDTNNCIIADEILITVVKDRNVYIPNVFSPNGDGQNDVLTIFADASVEEVLLFRIFDRWGEFIYEDTNFQPNDLSHGWDGTFKGEILQPAVFTYYTQVAFIDGSVLLYKGDVAIVR